MAVLANDGLELEIRYAGFEYGWVEYSFDCRWRGRPIFADEVMKRSPEGWAGRGRGQFRGNVDVICGLLPFFDELFSTRRPAFLEPIEADFIIAAYPNQFFPFLPSKATVVYKSECFRAERLAEEKAREQAGGVLDSDPVTLILSFDAYQFAESGYYRGAGPALHMLPSWGELKDFADALRREFVLFERQHGVLRRDEDEGGFIDPEDAAWWRSLLAERPPHWRREG